MTGGPPVRSAQELAGDYARAGIAPPPALGLLVELDPLFAQSCLDLLAYPSRAGVLESKVEHLVRLALNVTVTQLHREAARESLRAALAAGATQSEIVEVLQLVSVLGIHTLSLAAPLLAEELAETGAPVTEELTPREVALRERYLQERGTWSAPWDAMVRLDADFLETYLDFSLAPFRNGGALEPKVKELIWITVDVTTTHLHPVGARGHIRLALEKGASREEIFAVLQIATGQGLRSLDLGLELLQEALARVDAPAPNNHTCCPPGGPGTERQEQEQA
jgi:alkylhydroperoxidase/carboxymuconolactone decarboxylase family protein YurZ